jgi:hypothetical protein
MRSMNATVFYRIAAVVLLLFAAGHTFGFLGFVPPNPEGVAARDAMNGVHFKIGGGSYSYGGFYKGFGLHITAYMLFSAFLAWHLGTMAASNPHAIGLLGWAFFALQVAGVVLAWIYFFPVPVIFSVAAAVCVGLAVWATT